MANSIARILFFLWLLPNLAMAQANLLQSGPMVAWSDFRECAIWVQTKSQAKVEVRYREKGTSGPELKTLAKETDAQKAHTATLIADLVVPGKRYEYSVFINGKKVALPYPGEFQSQVLWQYRTDPPTFTLAAGSCAYINEPEFDRPGNPYGSHYEVFTELAKAKPDAMLWLGDNTYTREADWNSRTGIYGRYSHTRALKEMQPLLAATHHYATWDDHDFGPNDGDRSYWGKQMTSEAFDAFFPMPNSAQAGEGSKVSTFFWGDVQIFMLDDRWFRAPNEDKNPEKAFFGQVQLQWLRDALVGSRARFKLICSGGQLINPAAVFENYSTYPGEYRAFLKMLEEIRVPGVVLMSGDRHHSELMKLERPGLYPLYEITTSPLTAGVGKVSDQEKAANTLMVPGTLVEDQNFALLKFSGPAKYRVMTVSIVKWDGAVAWTRDIKATELREERMEEKK